MIYFDYRGNGGILFFETERITDIRLLDDKTIIIETTYTANKHTFSRTALVDIRNIQDIKMNLLKNQTNIEEVKSLAEKLYNIIKEVYKK